MVSAWWNGERIHDRVVLRERTPHGLARSPWRARHLFNGGVRYSRPAGESFALGEGGFTIAPRFKTPADRPEASKSPPAGEWKPDAKALFLRGGRLVYDIGWVGQMETERRYNDGKWHRVLLTHDEHGTAFLFVDGELVCEREDFVQEDDQGHVFKIGAASPDFGKAYRGEISDVTVFEHNVPEDKAEQWTRGEVINMGAPALAWAPQAAPIGEEPASDVEVVKAPIRLQADCSAVRFANVWVAPLDDVAGVDAPRAKVDDSRWPEYRRMDYGDALHWTYQVGEDRNIAQKGIAVRLDGGAGHVARPRVPGLRRGDGRIGGVERPRLHQLEGRRVRRLANSHAGIVGDVLFTNPVGPGWAKPARRRSRTRRRPTAAASARCRAERATAALRRRGRAARI